MTRRKASEDIKCSLMWDKMTSSEGEGLGMERRLPHCKYSTGNRAASTIVLSTAEQKVLRFRDFEITAFMPVV